MAALCAALAFVVVPQTAASATAMETRDCDFDDDGRDDQAIGIPGESVAGVSDMGAVQVLYGSGSGLRSSGNQFWHQDVAGISGAGEPGDQFGAAIACGDFDDDGYDDLAVGALGEDTTLTDVGAVNVIFGSPTGLTAAGNEMWTQDSAGIQGTAESRDRFGSALTAGDFDRDGADDLAVGVPSEKVGSASGAKLEGAVNVLYGSAGGLSSAGDQLWTQDVAGVLGVAEPGDLFGAALVSGDFDADGRADLAVGVPGENVGDVIDAGAINILFGSNSGLNTSGDQLLHQDTSGVLGVAESRDVFGWALTSGDFDANGADDLAVGAPGEDVGTLDSAGAVNVLYGTAAGLSATNDDLWTQDSTGIAGGAEAHDRFGESLTAADFSGNGRDDLAVGAPWDSNAGVAEVGAVNVLYGAASGLGSANNQMWHQNSAGIEGGDEEFDRFGETLSSGDFSGNGRADLAVGVPGESIGGITDIGALNVLYGTAAGLGSANDQLWHQNSAGIVGDGEPYDRFSGRLRSSGTYRIGFVNGTDVRVNGDRLSHSPPDRFDMGGVNGGPDYTIVAARAGTIRALVDSNSEPTNNNNYVWIEHSDGEWSKYTHFATGTVTDAGRSVGEQVSAGTVLGIEGDVGQADGRHLHHEVGIPNDPDNPIDSAGFLVGYNLDPVVCGIPGQTFVAGQTYTAGSC